MLKETLRQAIQKAVYQAFPEVGAVEVGIEYPADPTHGDYASPAAMQLAKIVKKPPREVAKALAEHLGALEFVQNVEIAGPGFLNFFVAPECLVREVQIILKNGEKYGRNALGKGKKIMIEYSQPNTNKPMHIGHMRNNFLGMAEARLFEANGYEVIPVNYVGDIGVHITKSMLGYLKWGKGETPESTQTKGDYFVGKFYQQFEAALATEPTLMEEAQEMLRKWEAGDPEIQKLWKQMNRWVYEGWKRSYERMGCRFDHYFYESTYTESGKQIAEEALEKGVAIRADNGAIIAQLQAHGLPDKVLLRGDGTSIYATKDLKLAEENFAGFGLEGRIYVVASQQKLYLEQVFKILELLGYEYAKRCFHLAYGIVSLPEGMMSSRKGNVVYADDLMNEVQALAYKEVEQRHPTEKETWKKAVAEEVMIGALKYGLLKVDPLQDITFDPSETVKFEGDTGPYLQYTHARLCSILRKGAPGEGARELVGNAVDATSLQMPEERAVLRKLRLYPEVIFMAAEGHRINAIANFLYDLAQLTNRFYVKHPVLEGPSEVLRLARLQLVAAVAQVLKNGLAILGIEAVERM